MNVSGKYGAVAVDGGVMNGIRNWNLTLSAPAQKEVDSSTKGFYKSIPGVKQASGSFQIKGNVFPVKINDYVNLQLYAGPVNTAGTQGSIFKGRALITGANWRQSWQNGQKGSNTTYSFTSDFVNT